MVRDDIKNSSLLKTKFLIYAFNGRTKNIGHKVGKLPLFLIFYGSQYVQF